LKLDVNHIIITQKGANEINCPKGVLHGIRNVVNVCRLNNESE